MARAPPTACRSQDRRCTRSASTRAGHPRIQAASRHGGSWEGLTDTEIRTGYPHAYAAWVPPDGEPVVAVAERAADAFERVAGNLATGSLAVVVSHGVAINLGMSRLV